MLSVEERVGGGHSLPENEHPPVACLVTLCYFAGTVFFSMSDRTCGRTFVIKHYIATEVCSTDVNL